MPSAVERGLQADATAERESDGWRVGVGCSSSSSALMGTALLQYTSEADLLLLKVGVDLLRVGFGDGGLFSLRGCPRAGASSAARTATPSQSDSTVCSSRDGASNDAARAAAIDVDAFIGLTADSFLDVLLSKSATELHAPPLRALRIGGDLVRRWFSPEPDS